MLVSIVIPMFNSEKYIASCINSILNQNFSDYEVIIVDDCSTDDSYKIAQSFRMRDERIVVVKNDKNKGICYTRNKGISIAHGKYISFLDDDDILLENFFQDNIRLLEEHSADFIKFGRKLVDINSKNIVLRESFTTFNKKDIEIYDDISKFLRYDDFKESRVLLNVWNGIYLHSFLEEKHLFFNEDMKYGSEDADFSYKTFFNARNVIINPNTYYVHFRRNLSSTSRKYNFNKIISLINTAKTEMSIWKKLNSEIDINKYKIEYIKIIISSQLLHKDNNMLIDEKIKVIKKVISEEPLCIDKATFNNDNFLDNILEYLIFKRYSKIIYMLYRIFKIFGGEKWN